MINKQTFKLKKNGEPTWDCYCRYPELIENYDKAISDTTQTWEVHHRLESCFAYKFLKDMGLYYDVEPEALIFLTHAEHRKVHMKGKSLSEETKRKIGEANAKKILCVETGEIFESAHEASRKTGVNFRSISKVCLGKRKTTGGYHWEYLPQS